MYNIEYMYISIIHNPQCKEINYYDKVHKLRILMRGPDIPIKMKMFPRE